MVKYYAVKIGKNPGIYSEWKCAEEQVKGFPGAVFKSFKTEEEASKFIESEEKDNLNKKLSDKEVNSTVSDEETIDIYVDGSFAESKKCYGSGWVAVIDDEPYEKKSFSGDDSRYVESRQVAGELLATLDAIQWAVDEKFKVVKIHYDYQGIENWAKKEWKANKAISKDYVNNYDLLSSNIKIEFIKVKAHSNNKYNDIADKLAKSSLLERGSRTNSDGSLTIFGIDRDELDLIFEIIESEYENLKISVKQNTDINCINYTLISNSDRVVINYYDTGVSCIQGKESSLMECVLIYILQLVEDSSEVIETLNVYNKVDVDEDIVNKAFNKCLPNYDSTKIKSNKLELVLTSAAYNYSLDIERPEYTDLVMPIMKALEVYLHEMLNYAGLKTTSEKKNGTVTNRFSYFDCENDVYSLQKAHEKVFEKEPDKLETLNDIYNFYNKNRHTLFHWDAEYDDTRIIETIGEAKSLIKSGFEYIDKYYVYY